MDEDKFLGDILPTPSNNSGIKYSLGFDNFIIMNNRVSINFNLPLNSFFKEMYDEKLSDLIPTGPTFMKTIFGGKK